MSMPASRTPSPSRENVLAVYRRIRRMILSGTFVGGQQLSQVQLALDFATSRGPVREALRMLQRDGLIEAETNQQGRIVTFSSDDLEQVCALLVLNVAVAVAAGEGFFTALDVRTIKQAVVRIEALGMSQKNGAFDANHAATRRQLAFRRLLTILCKYGGRHATQLIDDLLDRLAMFRQLYVLTGASPPYPLTNRFDELIAASECRDAIGMAQIIVEKIADVSRKALLYLDHMDAQTHLNRNIAAARIALATSDGAARQTMKSAAVTIQIRGLAGSQVEYEIIEN